MSPHTKLFAAPVLLILMGAPAWSLAIDTETDTNADGLLSLEEMQAALPDMTEELFILIDRTEDGLIDEVELAEAQDAALLPLTDG